MSIRYQIPIWKSSPFIRIIIPLIAGILLQWYLQFSLVFIITSGICFSVAFILFRFLPLSFKFKVQPFQGIIINLILVSLGLFITWQKDIRNDDNWFGNYYQNGDYLIARINEPPIEKQKSDKANGYVESLIHNDSTINCKGKLLLYFSKDSSSPALHYGDIVLIHANIQAIKNSGNPGEFDYQQYAAFQQIYHEAFLKKDDWVLLNEKNINHFNQFFFSTRESILSVVRKNIKSDNDESGIDEALLIGYTNDLDKELAQAYSNNGVSHIIAMSGMSLGLIYLVLLWIFNRIHFMRKSKFIKAVCLICCLWIFTLLTGESASVLRSAIVLTCIIIGKGFDKKSSIYNSLAVSAFILLCFNPYLLWDVGFQVSYLAVISILVFRKPIYDRLYVKNKCLNKLWAPIAIAISVQVLTFPICIYYFHQFPLLFLITNLIAIPLSTIILFGEILLLALSWVPCVGVYLGKIISWLTSIMNEFILWINSLSFSQVSDISLSLLSTWLLYAMLIGFCAWLINKNKTAFQLSLICTLVFVMLVAYSNWEIKHQNKIIVYNVAKHKAVDFTNGNKYQFAGDSDLLNDLKPSRIALHLNKIDDSLPTVFEKNDFCQVGDKRIFFADRQLSFTPSNKKISVDIIVISKSPKLYIPQLADVFNCNQYVFDASNSLWKIDKWKKDCEKLHLPFYSIPEKGAFVLNIE
jgi:competence protein ComEC